MTTCQSRWHAAPLFDVLPHRLIQVEKMKNATCDTYDRHSRQLPHQLVFHSLHSVCSGPFPCNCITGSDFRTPCNVLANKSLVSSPYLLPQHDIELISGALQNPYCGCDYGHNTRNSLIHQPVSRDRHLYVQSVSPPWRNMRWRRSNCLTIRALPCANCRLSSCTRRTCSQPIAGAKSISAEGAAIEMAYDGCAWRAADGSSPRALFIVNIGKAISLRASLRLASEQLKIENAVQTLTLRSVQGIPYWGRKGRRSG